MSVEKPTISRLVNQMMSILHFLFGSNHCIDRSALWAGIAVLLALVGVGIAYWQLRGIKKISRADFAKRFIDTFFADETRTLFALLMNSALESEVLEIRDKNGQVIDHMPFLKIRKDIANNSMELSRLRAARLATRHLRSMICYWAFLKIWDGTKAKAYRLGNDKASIRLLHL